MRQQKVRIAREPIGTATGRIAGWTLETDARFIQCLWFIQLNLMTTLNF